MCGFGLREVLIASLSIVLVVMQPEKTVAGLLAATLVALLGASIHERMSANEETQVAAARAAHSPSCVTAAQKRPLQCLMIATGVVATIAVLAVLVGLRPWRLLLALQAFVGLLLFPAIFQNKKAAEETTQSALASAGSQDAGTNSSPGSGSPVNSSARSSTGGTTSTAPQSSPPWPVTVLQKAALLAALFVLAGICMRWAQPWEILLATGGGILVLLLAMARWPPSKPQDASPQTEECHLPASGLTRPDTQAPNSQTDILQAIPRSPSAPAKNPMRPLRFLLITLAVVAALAVTAVLVWRRPWKLLIAMNVFTGLLLLASLGRDHMRRKAAARTMQSAQASPGSETAAGDSSSAAANSAPPSSIAHSNTNGSSNITDLPINPSWLMAALHAAAAFCTWDVTWCLAFIAWAIMFFFRPPPLIMNGVLAVATMSGLISIVHGHSVNTGVSKQQCGC